MALSATHKKASGSQECQANSAYLISHLIVMGKLGTASTQLAYLTFRQYTTVGLCMQCLRVLVLIETIKAFRGYRGDRRHRSTPG